MKLLLLSALAFLCSCSSYYTGCAQWGMTLQEVRNSCGKPTEHFFNYEGDTFIYMRPLSPSGYNVTFRSGKVTSVSPAF